MDLEKLYDQARAGDKTAEEELFRLLTVRFRLFAVRMVRGQEEARDVVQEAMVTIINGYREHESGRRFLAWSYSVLKHAILNSLRKQRRRKELDKMYSSDAEPSFRPDPDLHLRLHACLSELILRHPAYARVLNLKHQGYATEQICRMLDTSRDNLYVLLHRARTMLMACLKRGKAVS